MVEKNPIIPIQPNNDTTGNNTDSVSDIITSALLGLSAGISGQSIAPYLENMQRMRDLRDVQRLNIALQADPSAIYNSPQLRQTWEKVTGTKLSEQPQYLPLAKMGAIEPGQTTPTTSIPVTSQGYEQFLQTIPFESRPASPEFLKVLGLPSDMKVNIGDALRLLPAMNKERAMEALQQYRDERLRLAEEKLEEQAAEKRAKSASSGKARSGTSDKSKLTYLQAYTKLSALRNQKINEWRKQHLLDPNVISNPAAAQAAAEKYANEKALDELSKISVSDEDREALMRIFGTQPTSATPTTPVPQTPQIPPAAGTAGTSTTNAPTTPQSDEAEERRKKLFGR